MDTPRAFNAGYKRVGRVCARNRKAVLISSRRGEKRLGERERETEKEDYRVENEISRGECRVFVRP